MRRATGFTLIELLVVVAIIAILASIAVPWWGRYTFRSRRSDGQNMLMHVAQAEARYYTDYNHYSMDIATLGFASSVSPDGYYTVALSLPAGESSVQGFLVTATPQGVQAPDACGDLSLDSAGQKKPLPSQTARYSNGPCW